ncbi:MAG: hypothetical protein ACKOU6_06370 [Planctomycetota bacterium]
MKRWFSRRSRWVAAACLLAATMMPGCNRAHYRRQADNEGLALIEEKASNPHWNLDAYTLYVDPRSRMFDPFSADTPPIPRDDPAAHELMHRVDGKRGYQGWHYGGDTDTVENPVWEDYLPLNERGTISLDADMAMRLARLHKRTFQSESEELYLSALDVSFERFRFSNQFFAGYQTFYTADGPRRRGAGGNSSSLFNTGSYSTGRNPAAVTLQRSFTTGADLVVGMANSLMWQFSGPNDYSGQTLLDFSLIQPLLRGAGRDRVMERLTISERTLLSNVRSMERYRQAFYVDVLTGRSSAGDGPTRRGGVLGGAGFEGFSGVGAGGFGRLATTGAGGAGGGATGAGAGQAGGYLGLLQNMMQIRNSEINIRLLRSNLATLVDKEEGIGNIDPRTKQAETEPKARARLQVAQARQAILVQESRLLNSRNSYQQSLDNFKVSSLGLPPAVCVEVTDPLLKRFYLIDDGLEGRREELEQLRPEWGLRLLDFSKQIQRETEEVDGQPVEQSKLAWSDDFAKDLQSVRRDVAAMSKFAARVADDDQRRVLADEKDFERLAPTRIAQLEKLKSKFDALRNSPCALLQVPELDPLVFDPQRITKLQKDVRGRLGVIDRSLNKTEAEFGKVDARLASLLKQGAELEDEKRATEVLEIKKQINEQLDLLRNVILALELAQAQLRAESIALSDVDLPHESALEIARQFRHDWMNARASLVDSWRLIEFNADNLESTLNLVFSGDVSNTTQNPLNLNNATGRLRVGMQFDAPIVRLSERNTYRQSLIEYQQAKRSYYQFVDNLSRGLRLVLRTLDTNLVNFEFQRFAVSVAAEQNDLNTELLSRPGDTGPTAARDAVSALTDLLNAQNDFLSIWINYEVNRRQLDLDLGTMRVDEEGIWIDPGAISADYLQRVQQLYDYVPPAPDEMMSTFGTAPTAKSADEEVPAPQPEPPADMTTSSQRNKASVVTSRSGGEAKRGVTVAKVARVGAGADDEGRRVLEPLPRVTRVGAVAGETRVASSATASDPARDTEPRSVLNNRRSATERVTPAAAHNFDSTMGLSPTPARVRSAESGLTTAENKSTASSGKSSSRRKSDVKSAEKTEAKTAIYGPAAE